MKRLIFLSKSVLAVALALTMVMSSTAFAAVQSDAANAGQWASTYVFEDFNSAPTVNTITYQPNGTVKWTGEAGNTNTNGNFYRGIPSVNNLTGVSSVNLSHRHYPYGWGTGKVSTGASGSIGWLGSASDGFLGYNDSNASMNVFGQTGSIGTSDATTAYQNLLVNWSTDTVEVSYDYLINCSNYSGGDTLLVGIYDTYYNETGGIYNGDGTRLITYMPVVNYLQSGNLYLKYWDTNNSGKFKAIPQANALEDFNIDTKNAQQWVHISAVVSSNGEGNFTSKFYINGRPIKGELASGITAAGEHKTTLANLTTEGYVHKGVKIGATGRTPTSTRYQGVDNIKIAKYNDDVTMPTAMNIEDSTTSIEIPFTNTTYTGSEPAAVKEGAVDLSSITSITAMKNGTEDISAQITMDKEYTLREITTTTQVSTQTVDGKNVTFVNQDGTSLKLNGITSKAGDTIEITLNGAKDVTGKALANNKITLNNDGLNLAVDNNGRATINYNISNYATLKPTLIVAGYKDGALVSATLDKDIVFPQQSGTYNKAIENTNGATSYKAFLWDSLRGLKPLVDIE